MKQQADRPAMEAIEGESSYSGEALVDARGQKLLRLEPGLILLQRGFGQTLR
jgi:hypothetical protein